MNKFIDFNSMKKNERSEFINGIWGINQILKNTFLSFYLTFDGDVIPDKLNKLTTGFHYAQCQLNEYLIVPIDAYLRLDCTKIYSVIKDYKSLLDGILYKDDGVYFKIRDVGDVIIGKIVEPFDYDKNDKVHQININSLQIDGIINDNEMECLLDKEVLNKSVKEVYNMIICHKLFPSIKKSCSNGIYIEDYNDGFFGGTFIFNYNITNSSGKKLFSTMKTFHKYNFIKI